MSRNIEGVESSEKMKCRELKKVLEGCGVRCYEIRDRELENRILFRVTIHNLRFLLAVGR
jgi:hypothetical protein